MDYSIKITGKAGQGIQTIGETLARVFGRMGHHIFSHQDYESRIRGGHNFYQIRISDRPVMSPREKVDIIVALDKEGITMHRSEIDPKGMIIYDSVSIKASFEGPSFLDIPFTELAVAHGGDKIMSNVVATGAVLGMLGMEIGPLLGLIKEAFGKKGEDIIAGNVRACRAGYDFAKKGCFSCSFSVTKSGGPKMVISGVEAIALGAIASGVRFYAAYPMTPSTGIMNYLASKEAQYGIVVEQAEDEIAAINMAIGASFAGIRSMTATSGGGFCLMTEGLSLSGMTETPVVICLGQRPGPATGLPTRTEQGELLFSIFAGHGEFPRIVFAPGTPEQAFYLTNKAFDLSEKYQIPAIILFDQFLADSQYTYSGWDGSKLRYADYRLRGDGTAGTDRYKRHILTETGISFFAVPGDPRRLVVTDSDEHDEEGHIIEDADTRVRMVEKRLHRKTALLKNEIEPPILYGDHRPEIVIAGWGSTFGVMKEAVDLLSGERSIAMLHFSELWPFPDKALPDYKDILKAAKATICIENNATGQFARLMRSETGHEFTAHIHRFDGRPFTIEQLKGEIDAYIGKL